MASTFKVVSGSGLASDITGQLQTAEGTVLITGVTPYDLDTTQGDYAVDPNWDNSAISSYDALIYVWQYSSSGSVVESGAVDVVNYAALGSGGGGGGGATATEVVTALLNAITVTNTPTVVSSLGTYFVVTSEYSASLPNTADFIIQQNSLFPVFKAACYYQGNQIEIASATFRVWEAGNQLNNLVDAAMTVNDDYSVTYAWQVGDLPLAGTFQFQMIVTDTSGNVVPVPLTKNGIIIVTPEY